MPPKNASKGGNTSKKTEAKKKERVIEDKTFGLKNKKGNKQQKFIQQVQKQVQSGGNKSSKQSEKEREESKLKKESKKKELDELNDLFKPIQEIPKGVDPKSVLCVYFKQGQCSKGNKCKFSHDLNVARKAEKRSIYDEEKEESENWDEEKLKEVIEKKHGKETNKPTTTIVCKYFIDAVEDGRYGWFWNCANGESCIYRHALPAGYILKKDRRKMDREKEDISLEELIETERAGLGAETTKVTLQTFLAWKKKKLIERAEEKKKSEAKKKSDFKSGKEGGISGREMFMFNPELAAGLSMEEGDGDFDFKNMKPDLEEGEEEESNIQYKELDLNSLMEEYKDIDPDGTVISQAKGESIGALKEGMTNGEGAVAIDEDLFGGDDEDLEDLENELDELAVTS